jgi:hypothetical protein
MVHEAWDARVSEAGEQFHLSREAFISGVQGQLERHGPEDALPPEGAVDGAVGSQSSPLQKSPGAHPRPRRKACGIQVARLHGVPREE